MENTNVVNLEVKNEIQEVRALKIFFDEEQKKTILENIKKILNTGQLAAGEFVENFEKNWSEINKIKNGVAVSSGGAALEVIFKGLEIEKKDVLVPTNTFIATSNAVTVAGGNPILCDVSKGDMCLDLENIKKNLTENTKAICVVHIGGIISKEIEQIQKFCSDNKIYLVEDAAHGHGSTFNGKYPGSFGCAAAYSFFSTKTFTSGEGGMILTNDDVLASKFKTLRDYGKKSQWESVHVALSSNYRMSDLTAIVGDAHISKFDNFVEARTGIANLYSEKLSDKFERILPEGGSGWYKYIVLLPKGIDRSEFKKKCKNSGCGIPGGFYDLPLHLQPVYEHLNLKGKLSVSEDVCSRHICLPIYPNLTKDEQNQCIKILNQLIEEYK